MEAIDEKQEKIFIVQGTNWVCEVPLEMFNWQFPFLMQCEEAATRAIEQIQGIDLKLILKLEAGENIPELGGAVHIHLKDGDEQKGILLMVHELLANGGFYKDSLNVQIKTEKALREITEAQSKVIINKIDLSPPVSEAKVKKPQKPRKPKK